MKTAMKAMIIIQRIVATVVGMFGAVMMFSEVELTASALSQIKLFLEGVALVVVAIGWLVLTGLEEDWFVKQH